MEGNNTLKVLATIPEHTGEEDEEVEVLGEIARTLEVHKCAEVTVLVKGDKVAGNGVKQAVTLIVSNIMKQAVTLIGEQHNEV